MLLGAEALIEAQQALIVAGRRPVDPAEATRESEPRQFGKQRLAGAEPAGGLRHIDLLEEESGPEAGAGIERREGGEADD